MKPKPYLNKTWLERERYVKRKSVQEIADSCGVSYNTILNSMKKHKIR